MEEALYSALMGFVTGGVFEGAPAATTAVGNKITSGIEAKKNAKAETPTDAPQQAAPDVSAEVQAEAGKVTLSDQDPGTERSEGLQNVETKADSPDAAWDQAVQRYVQGGQTAPVATIRKSQTVESNTAKAEDSPLKAASKKYGAQAAMMENAYQEGQDVDRFDREYKLAYDMGKEGASRELMDGGAFAYLTAEQKNTAYQSGAAAAENTGIVAGAVRSLGITGENAGMLERSFNANQITAKDYAMGLQEAFDAGKTGIPLAQAGDHAAKLTDQQRQIAYKQGQKAHGKQVAKQQAQARKNRSAEGADTSKGKVHFEGDRSNLNKTQRASLDAMEVLAKTLGVQIYVFESEVDENGNHVGANGWYDPSDGSIHIDLYAGNSGKGTMLFTVAHELTHFIKQWSPAKFEVLANLLTKQYTAQGQSIAELVEAQQDKAARNGRELDYDAAYEEMVADSMESMLADGSVIEMMAELKQQDQSLWQKICDWFKDLAGKLRTVVDAYKGVQPDSAEGRMVADMKDMIGTLQALYMDALVDASENFDAGVQKITTQESDAAKFCVRDNEPTEFNPDGKSLESLLGDILKTAQSFDGRYLYVGKFTSEFRKIVKKYTEIKDLPVVMNYRDAYLAMESKDNGRYQGDGINYHNLGVDGMVDAINSFDMPDAVMLSKKEGKIELALQGVDRKGNKLLSIVALNTTAQNAKKFIEAHIVTSIYGRRGIENYIKKAEAEGRLVYNKKEESAQGIPQVQYEGDINANSPKPSIRNPELEVKKKFSLREPVERTKDLVALHNLTEDKLLKALDLGGFPMPSIAVTKSDIPHTNFGDITLVFGSETIDPKASRKNAVYSADACRPCACDRAFSA